MVLFVNKALENLIVELHNINSFLGTMKTPIKQEKADTEPNFKNSQLKTDANKQLK